MFYALSWSLVFILLTLWSLAAWAFHSIMAWTVSNAGALTGAASGVEGLRLPEWLARRVDRPHHRVIFGLPNTAAHSAQPRLVAITPLVLL